MIMMDWKGEFLESLFQMILITLDHPQWKAREEGLGLGIFEGLAFDPWEASILVMWSDLNQWEGSIATYSCGVREEISQWQMNNLKFISLSNLVMMMD